MKTSIIKRMVLATAAIVGVVAGAVAQSVVVVDSETIFKSQGDYNAAMTQIDELTKSYQTKVDVMFADVEKLFNSYASTRESYTAAQRQQIEATILSREEAATKFQEESFGSEGTLMKRRVELLKPIQDRVFGAIESYAKSVGADLVLDRASNPSMLYVGDGADRSSEVIEMLK